jgi:NAD-dependent dihydropyrimidine dehydrogenase PreA subunit
MLKYLENVVTLQLDAKVCNGCGMCVLVCPHAVFEIKDRKAVFADRDSCIECGACAINCPVNAIRVQTGAGCAAGVLLGAIGIDSCCSGACGASPAGGESDQSSCCGPKIENKEMESDTAQVLPTADKQKEMATTRSFIIYESVMCCSSGVCGPNPDKSLVELQDALDKLKDMGIKVERYNITENPRKFRENPEVIKLMQELQIKALPITTCDGKVIKVGVYPSLSELRGMIQESQKTVPLIKLNFRADVGCCSGKAPSDINCGQKSEKNSGGNAPNRCY